MKTRKVGPRRPVKKFAKYAGPTHQVTKLDDWGDSD